KLQALFGGRLEFRLSDPFDSQIGRKKAEELPRDVPGRALLSDENTAQIALPRLDGRADADDLSGEGVRDLVRRIAERWPSRRVPTVRTLPDRVGLDELLHGHRGADLVLGMGERDLAPVTLSLDDEPHLLVYGDPQTGKSTLLRALLRQIASRPPEEVGIVLVDYRRAHLGLVGEKHLLAYCTGPQHTQAAATELANSIRKRLPGPDVTPRQLRERSWWKGLEIFVVVDDMDIVAGRTSPLSPLAELLPQGRDIGFHLIAARRTGGASRAVFEPVLQGLGDMSTPGVLFSGDRSEGRLANGIASRRLPQGRAPLANRGRPPEHAQA